MQNPCAIVEVQAEEGEGTSNIEAFSCILIPNQLALTLEGRRRSLRPG